MQAGHEDIRIAVVVVVGDGHAHVVAGAGHAGGVGDVGEHAMAIIAEEAVAVFRIVLLERGYVCAVGEKDVGTAVAVIVKDRHPPRHGFGRILCGCLVIFQAKRDSLELESNGTGHSRGVQEDKRRGGHEQATGDKPGRSERRHKKTGWPKPPC